MGDRVSFGKTQKDGASRGHDPVDRWSMVYEKLLALRARAGVVPL